MEQRKLIRLGNSSFALALPKDWVDKAGLKKGDDIYLERNPNGEIVISTKYQKDSRNKTKLLDFSSVTDPKAMLREISVAYVQDNSKIEIKGVDDKSKKDEIRRILDGLMGIEIIESNEDKIIAKDFFDIHEVSIENFVRRMDNNIRGMLEEFEEAVKVGKMNQKQFTEIFDADSDINKFYLLINKLLIKGIDNPSVLNTLKIDVLTLFNSWWLAYNLEHIGDEIKRTARFLKQNEIQPEEAKKIAETFMKIKETYLESINSYYKRDKELAFKTIIKKESVMKLSDTLSQSKDSVTAKVGEKFKQLVSEVHQINKIIVYSLENLR